MPHRARRYTIRSTTRQDDETTEGITILEFSTMITAAPRACSPNSARVIKVEPTDAGDPMRYIGAQGTSRRCSLAATG